MEEELDNDDYEKATRSQSPNLGHGLYICLEGPRKTVKALSQDDDRYPG